MTKIINDNEYTNKISILKQDVAYSKEKIRELEEKNRAQEAQLKNQFEHIVKLKEKVKTLKSDDNTSEDKVSKVSKLRNHINRRRRYYQRKPKRK